MLAFFGSESVIVFHRQHGGQIDDDAPAQIRPRCAGLQMQPPRAEVTRASGRRRPGRRRGPSRESTARPSNPRSEEHTSELQSRRDLVCRLLLEKKKKK